MTKIEERDSFLSAIIPLKITGRHYGQNLQRLCILFSSLDVFCAKNTFSEIIVIAPDDETRYAEPLVHVWPDLPIKAVSEEYYLPQIHREKYRVSLRPWHFQQMLKLGACAASSTPFVVLFDPDVFAVRHFDKEFLIRDGKPIVHLGPKKPIGFSGPNYWEASSRILKIEINWKTNGLHVTPQALRRDTCCNMLARIEGVHGRAWHDVLARRSFTPWTEYTLYSIYSEDDGSLLQDHVSDDSVWHKIIVQRNVWQHSEFDEQFIDRIFSPQEKGLFCVVQSHAGVQASDLVSLLENRIPIKSVEGPINSKRAAWTSIAIEKWEGVMRKLVHSSQMTLDRLGLWR